MLPRELSTELHPRLTHPATERARIRASEVHMLEDAFGPLGVDAEALGLQPTLRDRDHLAGLDLANRLHESKNGVVYASPNWWSVSVAK